MTGTTEEEWFGLANGHDLDVPSVNTADGETRSGTKLKKPPTGEELRAIKDATDLYRSSSFKLQVCWLFYLFHDSINNI